MPLHGSEPPFQNSPGAIADCIREGGTEVRLWESHGRGASPSRLRWPLVRRDSSSRWMQWAEFSAEASGYTPSGHLWGRPSRCAALIARRRSYSPVYAFFIPNSTPPYTGTAQPPSPLPICTAWEMVSARSGRLFEASYICPDQG